jgi:Protein of unknown function (DUF2844)
MVTRRSAARVILVVLTLALPKGALASLGGDTASVADDSAFLRATRLVTRAATWELHELRLSSGTRVREYVSAGTVFAVAWSGPAIPDLRRLLGSYFDRYVNSPRAWTAGHHMRVVATSEWVVQSAGHQDGFIGRAWLPGRLPNGFEREAIRAW